MNQTPWLCPGSVEGMSNSMRPPGPAPLVSWIAAKSVHSGALALFVPPVLQAPSPGLRSVDVPVELTMIAVL